MKVSEMQSEFLKSYSLIGESDVGIMVIEWWVAQERLPENCGGSEEGERDTFLTVSGRVTGSLKLRVGRGT